MPAELLGFLGLSLSVWGLLRILARPASARPVPWSGAEAAACVLAWLVSGIAWAGRFGPDARGTVLASVAHGLSLLLLFGFLAARKGRGGLFGAGAGSLGWGILGGGVSILGAFSAVQLLERLRGSPIADDRHPFILLLRSEEAGLPLKGAAVLLAVVLAPLVEEVLFRRVLFSAFGRVLRPAAALAATSLLFGLAHHSHGDFPWTVPVHAWIGLVLGALVLRTGSLWPSVLAHGLNNAVALAWALWAPDRVPPP